MLHADDIADAVDQRRIERDEEIDGAPSPARELRHQRVEQRALRFRVEIGGEVLGQAGVIGEGHFFGVRVDEKVKGIDHRQLGQKIHLHREMIHRLWKDNPRLPVAMRILLPVEEMLWRADLQRIIRHGCAAVRGRP